ncbi:hypothetical protein NXS19_011405 [Fusarium pseudograminearum]|nr:hypothetical protein NXS19_011405 [Fusarium pseudograminearum]
MEPPPIININICATAKAIILSSTANLASFPCVLPTSTVLAHGLQHGLGAPNHDTRQRTCHTTPQSSTDKLVGISQHLIQVRGKQRRSKSGESRDYLR